MSAIFIPKLPAPSRFAVQATEAQTSAADDGVVFHNGGDEILMIDRPEQSGHSVVGQGPLLHGSQIGVTLPQFHQASRSGRNFGEKRIDVEGQPEGVGCNRHAVKAHDTAGNDTGHFTYKLPGLFFKTMVCPSGKPPVNS